FGTQKFHYCEELFSKGNWKREGTVKAFCSRNRRARKITAVGNIRNPSCFKIAPHTSGQINSGRECEFHGCRLELAKLARGLPHVKTTQHAAVRCRHPEPAYFPSERFTNSLENFRHCVGEGGRF